MRGRLTLNVIKYLTSYLIYYSHFQVVFKHGHFRGKTESDLLPNDMGKFIKQDLSAFVLLGIFRALISRII